MRASRLVSILLLLQTRGRLTAQQLADALEVSVRTIYRDAESLHTAGVPLYGDSGPAGGYQLLGGYRTRLTGMTAAEAEALSLAGIPRAAAELGLGTVLATAQLKLQAALPAELRERAGRIQERFHLDAPGWYHHGDTSPYLAAVADAVWEPAPGRGAVPPLGGAGRGDQEARPARAGPQGRQVVPGGPRRTAAADLPGKPDTRPDRPGRPVRAGRGL
jgi:predicted DNA-binding transcriptional regulator YafY